MRQGLTGFRLGGSPDSHLVRYGRLVAAFLDEAESEHGHTSAWLLYVDG
jgi:hypothetical protein